MRNRANTIHDAARLCEIGCDSGDGGPATVARISTPFGIAIDSTNNVYFSDYDNRKIKKIDTNGIISTIAGNGQTGFGGDGGPATNATFFNPSGIAIDRAGNIYIADGENHRIRIINSLGIISTFAGNGNSGHSGDGGLASDAEINSPFAVTSDIEGNIYIGDASDYRVRKVNSVRTISTVAGTGVYGYSGDGGPATAAKLNGPAGLVTDLNHNLYIADENNNRIRKVNNR